MIIRISDKYTSINNRIIGFDQINLSEEDYESYKTLSTNGFIKTDRWVVLLYKKKSKNNVQYFAIAISTYIEIISCQQDISTSERKYSVVIFNGKENITLTFDSSILTSAGTKKLLQHGCIFDESNLKFLLQYLSTSACNAPIEYVHSHLGWNFDKEPMFLSSECISKSDIQSRYIGELDIIPHGSLEESLEMIQNEVIGNPTLEFTFALGHSAPILGFLNKYLDLGCLVFNYGNSSSKGKTTAGILIASAFGNPSIGNSLMNTFDGTDNALVTFVSNANAHPVVLDEIGTSNIKNFRKLLYQFCSGKERSRNDKEGNNKKSRTFNNIIIMTSEFPVIDETASDGIRARAYEITSDVTKNADNADSIKRCAYSNYGHTGIGFIRFIVANKLDSIIDDYENNYNTLLELYKKNDFKLGNLTKRILSKLTVILLTARYLKECFTLNIDIKVIVKTIIDLERSVTNESDISEKALDSIRQYVATHKNHFIFGCDDWVSTVEGRVRGSGQEKEITILKSVVEKILKDNGFENHRVIYKMWSNKKILITEKDRPYKRIRLTSTLPSQPCFIFKISE